MTVALTKGLANLRSQVNATFPNRDKTSDGTIGDKAHQAETSGHNPDDTKGAKAEWNADSDTTPEIRAWDMDSDLGCPGTTAQMVVDHIRKLPKVSSVLRYMIYNRKIYEAANGWAPKTYTGASAHTEHIHFTGAYTQAADSNTTFNYRLGELVALTADDKTWLTAQITGLLHSKVTVGDDQWEAGTAIGYSARKSYLNGLAITDAVNEFATQVLGRFLNGTDAQVAAMIKSYIPDTRLATIIPLLQPTKPV